jgi:hypothetical protein
MQHPGLDNLLACSMQAGTNKAVAVGAVLRLKHRQGPGPSVSSLLNASRHKQDSNRLIV